MTMDLTHAIGRIEGAIEAGNKATEEKFEAIILELRDQKKKDESLNDRVTVMETDEKVVTRLAGLIGAVMSIITTSVIALAIRILT